MCLHSVNNQKMEDNKSDMTQEDQILQNGGNNYGVDKYIMGLYKKPRLKIPKRGPGIAQLEKMRLKQQQKKTEVATFPATLPALSSSRSSDLAPNFCYYSQLSFSPISLGIVKMIAEKGRCPFSQNYKYRWPTSAAPGETFKQVPCNTANENFNVNFPTLLHSKPKSPTTTLDSLSPQGIVEDQPPQPFYNFIPPVAKANSAQICHASARIQNFNEVGESVDLNLKL